MRARAALAIVSLLLSSCTGSSPERPAERPAGTGAERREIRAAVVAFLDAFAGHGGSVGDAVSGRRLEDWAGWIDRYAPATEALLGGRLEVGDVEVLALEGDVARVMVDAEVVATLHEPGGRVTRALRRFVGPMVLVREGDAPGGWTVTDFVRDGHPMSLTVTVFDEVASGDPSVEVEVRSLYRFGPGTHANLRITNRGETEVVIDRPHSLLQAAGRWVGATGATDAFAMPIAPGASVEGALDFHRIPVRWLPERLMLHLQDERVIAVDLPFEAFIAA